MSCNFNDCGTTLMFTMHFCGLNRTNCSSSGCHNNTCLSEAHAISNPVHFKTSNDTDNDRDHDASHDHGH